MSILVDSTQDFGPVVHYELLNCWEGCYCIPPFPLKGLEDHFRMGHRGLTLDGFINKEMGFMAY